MTRAITQILVGIMLFFGAATLFPKAYGEIKSKRHAKGLMYIILGLLALFFSIMAFCYAYFTLTR